MAASCRKRSRCLSFSHQEGFSILEVVVALSILTLGLLGLSSLYIQSIRLSNATEEQALALSAATRLAETMGDTTHFHDIFPTYKDQTFPIPELGSTAQATIHFPTVNDTLRENVNNPSLGMPQDLNGDGIIDSADHSGDYLILPVEIDVTWQGTLGSMNYTYQTILGDTHVKP